MTTLPTTAAQQLPRWADLKAIADGQRLAMIALLAGIFAIPLTALLATGAEYRGPMGYSGLGIATLVFWAVRAWMAYAVYRLAKALDSAVPALWAVGAFLPGIVGLAVLAIVSARATTRLKKVGLKVGLLGAKLPEKPPPGFMCQEVTGAFS